MKYYGRSFPTGNQYQYPAIERGLALRGIVFESRDNVLDDGRIQRRYRFAESELGKLPQDDGEPYLPVNDFDGYSLWEMTDEEWEEKS